MAVDDAQLLNETDEQLLEQLSDGKRYTAALLANILDIDRDYINTRLTFLAKIGRVERVHHGLYAHADADD